MIYLIKDVITCILTGRSRSRTIRICQTEEDVLEYLGSVENLKNFKGDIKIEKVIL